jgi:type VI secretion system secreted protein Hcp
MAIYIEYEGINGNVTAKGYEGQIRCDSCQFGVGRGITMEVGNMSNREASRPNLSEFTFTHKTDVSATALFKEATIGSAGKKVIIHFVQTGSDKLVEYMTYTLEDVLVSGYSISADFDSASVETVSLAFSKVEVKYQDHEGKNKGASQNVVGYNLYEATGS